MGEEGSPLSPLAPSSWDPITCHGRPSVSPVLLQSPVPQDSAPLPQPGPLTQQPQLQPQRLPSKGMVPSWGRSEPTSSLPVSGAHLPVTEASREVWHRGPGDCPGVGEDPGGGQQSDGADRSPRTPLGPQVMSFSLPNSPSRWGRPFSDEDSRTKGLSNLLTQDHTANKSQMIQTSNLCPQPQHDTSSREGLRASET